MFTLYDTMDYSDFLFVCTTRVVLGKFYSIMEHSVYTTHVQSYRQITINHIQTTRKNIKITITLWAETADTNTVKRPK